MLDPQSEIEKLQSQLLANREGMTEREEHLDDLRGEVDNLNMSIKKLTDSVAKSEKLLSDTYNQLWMSQNI